MNHASQYRTGLPHHLQHHGSSAPPLQTFAGRFPPANLDTVNSVMIPSISHDDPVQYHNPIQPFHGERHGDQQQQQQQQQQQLKMNEQRKTADGRNFPMPGSDCERQENCQDGGGYKPTTSTPNAENQFPQHCSQGSKNCIQCYKGQPHTANTRNNKIMVDVATMTDAEEDPASNWQNVTVPPNTKVAEYLSSLRQFLKLSNPSEGKRRLGDVRIVTSTDGSRLYCCPECHMAYPDKSLLEPHLASHKIERRFVCGVCGAGLKRKEHLDRHQLSHSDERPYSCAACPKTFKRNEHLVRHYIIHSGEKAQMDRRFVCGVCGTGHVRREHLERHRLSHTEHRPHVCPACHKAFKRNEHLARHLVTHSGLKTQVCLECGKAFYRKDHLRKHALAHQAKRIRLAGIHCDTKLPLALP